MISLIWKRVHFRSGYFRNNSTVSTSFSGWKYFNPLSVSQKGNPIVIEINSKILEADSIGFDWNISLKLCSQCITYQKNIEVNSILKNIESIKNAKMIFDEPENLNTPVVWNMLEERTWSHLEKIGYQYTPNKVKKIKL